jgi:hypothetical protein
LSKLWEAGPWHVLPWMWHTAVIFTALSKTKNRGGLEESKYLKKPL